MGFINVLIGRGNGLRPAHYALSPVSTPSANLIIASPAKIRLWVKSSGDMYYCTFPTASATSEAEQGTDLAYAHYFPGHPDSAGLYKYKISLVSQSVAGTAFLSAGAGGWNVGLSTREDNSHITNQFFRWAELRSPAGTPRPHNAVFLFEWTDLAEYGYQSSLITLTAT